MSQKKLTRRKFLVGTGVLGASAGLGCLMSGLARGDPEENDLDRRVYVPRVTRFVQSDRWNFITIICDTLRYDHVGFHGNTWIQTPNIDAFAAQSLVFDKAYAGGFPTLLNRAELFTGRYMYTTMRWENLPEGEVVTAQVMNDAGYTTGLVFDTPHFKDHGFTLDRSFKTWQWIRGQEADRYRANPLHPTLPADPSKFRHGAEAVEQYLRNMAERVNESDYLVARTMQAAIEWLRRNYDENAFWLHVDAFDPHEPWDPPQSYVDLYNPDYAGEEVIYPAYAPPDYLTDDELEHVRALYAAEITMVDHWLGILLDEIDTLGLTDHTIVILTSDHGILLGEHNRVGKAWDHEGHYECYPLYEELTHIPLMIRVPDKTPRRIEALAQPADLMPTILEIAGAIDPGTMQGVSLAPVVDGEQGTARTVAVSSRSLRTSRSIRPRITVTDGQWTLIHGADHADSELYYLPDDPQQQTNLIVSQCNVARNLHAHLISFLESTGVEETSIAPWRASPC